MIVRQSKMSKLICQHTTIHSNCHIDISKVIEDQSLKNNPKSSTEDLHKKFQVSLTWKCNCQDCDNCRVECTTKTRPIDTKSNKLILPIPYTVIKNSNSPQYIKFSVSGNPVISGIEVPEMNSSTFLDKMTCLLNGEAPEGLTSLAVSQSQDSFLIPQNKKMCIVVKSTKQGEYGSIAFILVPNSGVSRQNEQVSTDLKNTHMEKIVYPIHSQVKRLTSLYNNRMALKPWQQCKQMHDWSSFSSLIDNTQGLITKMQEVCADVEKHQMCQVHEQVSDHKTLKFWKTDSICLTDTLPEELQKRVEHIQSQTEQHLTDMIHIQLSDGLQKLKSILPCDLFEHVNQTIKQYDDIQQRASWNGVHEHDTNRIDIVNVRALYVGIRAIETFLEHVVSHTTNHANLDRYIYRSYAHQLNQMIENNDCNSIELDHQIYVQIRDMLQGLQSYTIKHIDYRNSLTTSSDTSTVSLLPPIHSPHFHEITARACVQGILTQGCLFKDFKDTRQTYCHNEFYNEMSRAAVDDRHQKAIMSMCDMLEIDVKNRILHPSHKNDVINLLSNVQRSSKSHYPQVDSLDMTCLDIFNAHTRPLVNYAIFGSIASDTSDDRLYGFLNSQTDVGVGYNKKVLCELIEKRLGEIKLTTRRQYNTNCDWFI